MPRSWITLAIVAVFIAAPGSTLAGGNGQQQEVKLTGDLVGQPKDRVRDAPALVHILPFKQGNTYEILMVGQGFDAFLRLEDAKGNQLAQDDDSGGDLNALIKFNCPTDGNYRIICTAFSGAGGKYELTVKGPGLAGGKGKEKQKQKQKDVTIQGNNSRSPKDKVREQSPADVHIVPLQKGKVYEILMRGQGFDAYLRVEDSKGNQLDEDDDSGGNLDALIIFQCPKDDDYRIICTAFGNNGGAYVLSVKLSGAFKELPAGLSNLSDKAAPDLKGDFIVNGKQGRISDFKGKVVLLNFFAVQSTESVNMLPRLTELYKKHKADGLEIVGVTYYNSELGHKFGFDSNEGRLTKIGVASLQTDQAMLAAFAAFHKLEYPLLILNKDNALKAYENYLVNGLPQVVLIDRKGMVRFSFTGEVRARSEDVDSQLNKLLAER